MKRILVAAFLLSICLLTVRAVAEDVKSGGPITDDLICTSAEWNVSFEGTHPRYMPSSYTLWSNDATEFRFIRRFSGGLRDTVAIVVPAGTSMNIMAPDAIYEGGVYTHTIFIGGHTDTVYAAPWHK